MQGSSDILRRLFPDGPDPLAAATLLPALAGDDPAAIARVNDALRRLSLLVAVAEIVADVYRDPRFNPEIDRRTGYRTRDILCVPLRNHLGRTIGVTEALNKRSGPFTELDIALLEAINMEHKQPCRAEETP